MARSTRAPFRGIARSCRAQCPGAMRGPVERTHVRPGRPGNAGVPGGVTPVTPRRSGRAGASRRGEPLLQADAHRVRVCAAATATTGCRERSRFSTPMAARVIARRRSASTQLGRQRSRVVNGRGWPRSTRGMAPAGDARVVRLTSHDERERLLPELQGTAGAVGARARHAVRLARNLRFLHRGRDALHRRGRVLGKLEARACNAGLAAP